jgi:hypothetical protein
MIDLFARMATVDAEVVRVNSSSPDNTRLQPTELGARKLRNFSRAEPSILKELKLPCWEESSRQAWPPRRTIDPALFAWGAIWDNIDTSGFNPPYRSHYDVLFSLLGNP